MFGEEYRHTHTHEEEEIDEMIHGIGVDLLHIPRLARLLTKSYGAAGLPRRILTFAERDAYRRLTTHDARVSYLSTR